MQPEQSARQLTSWKEIADHLGVSLRTAQTWEREKGLPVQRMTGEKGRVAADIAALDAWRQAALHARPWWSNTKYLQAIAVVSTALLIIVCTVEAAQYLYKHRNQQPVSYRLGRRSITVVDASGNDLWRKAFEEPLESADYADSVLAVHRRSAFADIDGDGSVETLFVYSPVNSLRNPGALYCFSHSGEERWSFAPARMVTSNGQSGTHVINDVLIAPAHGSPEADILLLDCQLPAHSATLFVLSPRGEVKATFAHEGHLGTLETADVDGCGSPEILMGGFASERNEAELIVLQLPRDIGVKSGEQGELASSTSTPVLKEKAILAFPRTCVNKKLAESNRIGRIADSGKFLTVVVSELSDDPAVEVTYQLDRNLHVKEVWFSDALRNLHRTLQAQGVLDHPLTAEEVRGFRRVELLPPHGASVNGSKRNALPTGGAE